VDFTLGDDERLLAETCRRFALERLAPSYRRWATEPFPRDQLRELAALGVLGIRVPPERGGSGGSYVSLGVAAEELSRGDFNVSYFLQLGTIAAELLAGADDDVADAWLARIAEGDAVVAFGLTEPGVGSDAANLSASARRAGDDWLVSGEKASITFAGTADACIVFARSGGPGARGISTLFVPLDLPGVSRRVYSSAGGHLSQRGSLFFDEVRVPDRYRLGPEGVGFVQAMTAFDYNRAVIALACIGCALQSLDETIEHAKRGEAFGKPLATHEGVAFQVAEHLAHLHAARLVAYETGAGRRRRAPHLRGGDGQVARPEVRGRGHPRLPAPARLGRLRHRLALRSAAPGRDRPGDRRRHPRDHEGHHRPGSVRPGLHRLPVTGGGDGAGPVGPGVVGADSPVGACTLPVQRCGSNASLSHHYAWGAAMGRNERAGHRGRRALRLAGAVVTVPLHATAAVLASPRDAKTDPASRRLDELRDHGWRPVEVRLRPHRTEVVLARDEERSTVAGETLAFAAHATLTGAVVHRTT